MKLTEIFEPSVSNVKTNRAFSRGGEPPTTKNELGRGTFSIASTDPSDPHLIKKRQYIYGGGMQDAFDLYANEIVKNKLWDNIHFPRIYSIKSIEDRTGKKLHKWKIEKLHPLRSLNAKELKYLATRTFNQSVAENVDSWWDFTIHFSSAIRGHYFNDIKDQELAQALELIADMYEKFSKEYPRMRLDLHEENMMARRTNLGVQLVITDPFVLTAA